jgi:DNA helicase-2/ATP-dependent DNA helicase PcrA
MIKLTKEQYGAVNEPGSVLVKACPGSGKTRAIVAKLIQLCTEVAGTPRKVACITYTNAAVSELSSRVSLIGGLPSDTCEICTIHTFCLANILRPFAHLLEGEVPRGFGILGPDSPQLFEVGGRIFGNRIGGWFFRDILLNIRERQDGIFIPAELRNDKEEAHQFHQEIRALGLLTFGDILFFAAKLVAEFPFIRRSLASRFRCVVVDEFQDTSEEQADIISAVAGVKINDLFLVGDEKQSIYGSFSGARPDLFLGFSGNAQFEVTPKSFTGNFRSSAIICSAAESIYPRKPAMVALGAHRECPLEVEVFTVQSGLKALTEHFIPAVKEHGVSLGDCAILSPQWNELRSLGRSLSARGFAVVGPGARPYRRASEFTGVAEAAAECVVFPSTTAAARLEGSLIFCLRSVNRGDSIGTPWDRRRAVSMIRAKAKELYKANCSAVEWIEHLANFSAEALLSIGLVTETGAGQIRTTAEMMIRQIDELHRREDTRAFGLNELAMFSNPREALELSTLHSSKGREWDAVAIVDLHDGKIPHRLAVDKEESKRLFYVGCTRAKRLLMLFCYEGDHPCPYLELLKN